MMNLVWFISIGMYPALKFFIWFIKRYKNYEQEIDILKLLIKINIITFLVSSVRIIWEF